MGEVAPYAAAAGHACPPVVAGQLPGPHRNPFDRMLVAQTREEKLALVSNDIALRPFGVPMVW